MTAFTVKESSDFRLVVKKNPCLSPKGLNNIEFVQESIKDNEVISTSTYQFFMTDEEIKSLTENLTK